MYLLYKQPTSKPGFGLEDELAEWELCPIDKSAGVPFLCTRRIFHSMPHMAGTRADLAVAEWDDDRSTDGAWSP